MLEKDLQTWSIPVLHMDREYLMGGTIGQVRTRVQAFVESIEKARR